MKLTTHLILSSTQVKNGRDIPPPISFHSIVINLLSTETTSSLRLMPFSGPADLLHLLLNYLWWPFSHFIRCHRHVAPADGVRLLNSFESITIVLIIVKWTVVYVGRMARSNRFISLFLKSYRECRITNGSVYCHMLVSRLGFIGLS
jgi:hypothetical protein